MKNSREAGVFRVFRVGQLCVKVVVLDVNNPGIKLPPFFRKKVVHISPHTINTLYTSNVENFPNLVD